MKSFRTLSILVLIHACNSRPVLSTNPLEPNYYVTPRDLANLQFQLRPMDPGVCTYTKPFTDRVITFYLDAHCEKVKGQHTIFPLGFRHDLDDNSIESVLTAWRVDSLTALKIVERLGGEKTSQAHQLGGSSAISFDVKHVRTSKAFKCLYVVGEKNMGSVSFETHWP